ncbi:hypothetical protein C5167_015740 [Papaver somniferum]|uniref:PGG domain-containing protein n=1 Tax=Papaver somniferum TaxID=3469 RepID=A0A4Y7JAT4_PAPSO|nr:hypothetical protein C5167_015740 [Papaver somniferum]
MFEFCEFSISVSKCGYGEGHHVDSIIDNFPCQNHSAPGGRTVLHIAVLYTFDSGAVEVAIKLLDVDPTVAYIQDKDGMAALHHDAGGIYHPRSGHQSDIFIEHVIRRCPDCWELVDSEGRNFLHVAVEKKRSKVVKYVFDMKSNYMVNNLIHSRDEHGNTPWNLALESRANDVNFLDSGGSKSDVPNEGMATVAKKAAFIVFVVSNSLAMLVSVYAVFIHFWSKFQATVLSHKYELISVAVPALACTFVAILAMSIAFLTGTYTVLSHIPRLGIPSWKSSHVKPAGVSSCDTLVQKCYCTVSTSGRQQVKNRTSYCTTTGMATKETTEMIKKTTTTP